MITRLMIIILGLLSLSPYTLAVDDPIIILAQTRVSDAYQQFAKKLENCRGTPLNLTPQRQKAFNLTPAQWSIALQFLYHTSNQQCMGNTETQLGTSIHRYFALQKKRRDIDGYEKTTLEPLIMTDGTVISLDFVEKILYALYEYELKAQLKFNTLPERARQALLDAPEFKKPFISR